MKIDQLSLKTGIPLIDRQHEEYADLVNRFFDMAEKGHVGGETLAKEWQGVIDYAVEHFDAEEHLMRSKQYPHYEEHLAKHNDFRDKVDRLSGKIADNNQDLDAFTIEAGKMLVEWFYTQVKEDDMKLAAFVNGTGSPHYSG